MIAERPTDFMEIMNDHMSEKDEMENFIENECLVSLSDEEDINTTTNTIDSTNKETNKETKKRHLVRDYVKKSDPGYNVYYIIKNKVKVKIEMYSTGVNVGTLIRCPFTGIRTGDRVGTVNENFYFKARMPSMGNGDMPLTMYYTTPDSFERHHFINLPQYIKNEWYKKNNMIPPQEKQQENIEIH